MSWQPIDTTGLSGRGLAMAEARNAGRTWKEIGKEWDLQPESAKVALMTALRVAKTGGLPASKNKGWHPISTAPRDGTKVIVAWCDGGKGPATQETAVFDTQSSGGEWVGYFAGRTYAADYELKGWRPLPPPPEGV